MYFYNYPRLSIPLKGLFVKPQWQIATEQGTFVQTKSTVSGLAVFESVTHERTCGEHVTTMLPSLHTGNTFTIAF